MATLSKLTLTFVFRPSVSASKPKLTEYKFKVGLDKVHFEKHYSDFVETFGYGNKPYKLGDYLIDAQYVIKNGTYSQELNAYVAIAGGKGTAKYGVVGINRATKEITTFHLKSVYKLEKVAHSLSLTTKRKPNIIDLIGIEPELGWQSPYRKNKL